MKDFIILSTFFSFLLVFAATSAASSSPFLVNSAFAQTSGSSSISGNCIVESDGRIICIGTATGLEPTVLKGPPGQCYPNFNPTKCNLIERGDIGLLAVTQQVQITSKCKPDSSSADDDNNTAKPVNIIVKFGGLSDTEAKAGTTVFDSGNDSRTPILQIPATSGSASIEGQLQTTTCSGNQVQIGPTMYQLIGSATFTLH